MVGKGERGFVKLRAMLKSFGSSLGCSTREPMALNLLSQYCKMTECPVSGPLDKPSSSHTNSLASLG